MLGYWKYTIQSKNFFFPRQTFLQIKKEILAKLKRLGGAGIYDTCTAAIRSMPTFFSAAFFGNDEKKTKCGCAQNILDGNTNRHVITPSGVPLSRGSY